MAERALARSADIVQEVMQCLQSRPKRLPPKFFYDDTGSDLFDQITALPEYYLTRTEEHILAQEAGAIAAAAGAVRTVVELGSGSARKTGHLLRALRAAGNRRLAYRPVDISSAALAAAGERFGAMPGVQVQPMLADYTRSGDFLHHIAHPCLLLYLGSSIGNFDPLDAAALLRRVAADFTPEDGLVLGTDLRKSPQVLLPAYDDAAGVTARFNLNLLRRLNRELGAQFQPERFRHQVRWNPQESRIEMHLESTCDQQVWIGAAGEAVGFGKGETIHTENSYKYTLEMVDSILRNAGLRRAHTWTDQRGWFAVHLVRSL